MTRERFKELVQEAIDSIPRRFAREATNVAIVVEDYPSAELLREMEMGDDDVLLGLYQGVPLPDRQWAHGNALPDCITLYQKSIEDDCDDDEDEMEELSVNIEGREDEPEDISYDGKLDEDDEDFEDELNLDDLQPLDDDELEIDDSLFEDEDFEDEDEEDGLDY